MQIHKKKLSSTRIAHHRESRKAGKENIGLSAAMSRRAKVASIRNKLRRSGQSNSSRRPLQKLGIDVATFTMKESPMKDNNSDKIRKVQYAIDARIRDFGTVARMLKYKVEGISEEFAQLSEEIRTLQEYYAALDDNYHNALASVEEEKKTVEHFRGALANADVQIMHLERAIPESELPLAFSQAKPGDMVVASCQTFTCLEA